MSIKHNDLKAARLFLKKYRYGMERLVRFPSLVGCREGVLQMLSIIIKPLPDIAQATAPLPEEGIATLANQTLSYFKCISTGLYCVQIVYNR